MRVIGHRGCLAHFPENSLEAIRGCGAHVDMIEIDVRRCATGELVVFHDEKLDRLTDASGPVREYDFEELSQLTIGDSDETIPSFEQALDAVPDGVGLNIELKHPEMSSDIIPLIRERTEDIIVSSFDTDATAEFSDVAVPTAHLFTEEFEKNLSLAIQLGCEYVHPHYDLVTPETVELAHDHRMTVNAWTVPTEEAVIEMRDAGVDGVIVDSWTLVPDAR